MKAEGRNLIITADDFGLSPGLNAAVALAHRFGLLTSASLMVTGPAWDHAVALARELPDLCLGVHLTLIQGRAVLSPRAVPHLVDAGGNFPNAPIKTGWRYYCQPQLLFEIRRELAAQIEAALKAGLRLWHLNSHLNLHLHPRIFPLVVELAREYGIPAVRLPREDWLTTLILAPDAPLSKAAQGLIFAWLTKKARRLVQAAGLLSNDHFFGLTHDGRLSEEHLLKLLPRLKPGLTEICCHPALYPDPELLRWAPRYQRQAELAALTSPRLKAMITAGGLHLTDFKSLLPTHCSLLTV